jgi:hypothetical protein
MKRDFLPGPIAKSGVMHATPSVAIVTPAG